MTELNKSAPAALKKLKNRIKVAAAHDRHVNSENFKSLKGGLYEFKISNPATRLYAFYDELPDLGHQLIIITSGGGKRAQSADIAHARELKSDYLKAKQQPETLLRIQKIKRNEDCH